MADMYPDRLPSAAGRKLHIGAKCAAPGWETLNVLPLAGIDHVMDARDLTCFPDNSFTVLYASHVLEHFDYRDELLAAVREWYRVLVPGGRIFISVPDLDILCRLFTDRSRLDANDRFRIMRMMFGGHADSFDYHLVGLNEEFLTSYLTQAGFRRIAREQQFDLFDDTSLLQYKGELISLNMVAEKPLFPFSTTVLQPEGMQQVSFSITRNGTTYPCRYFFDVAKPTQRIMAAHLLKGELYEPELSLFFMRVLQEGDCFVDVGANVGFFTVIAAMLVGKNGCVHAFEPEQHNFNGLIENIALNQLANVIPHQAAVGEADCATELYINSDNDGGHALWNPGAHSFNQRSRKTVIKQPTELVKLDTVLPALTATGSRIKVLKIDTEGYEQHVLTGAVGTIIAHRIPFVCAEINRLGLKQSGTRERGLLLFMRHLGYTPYSVTVDEHTLLLRFHELPLHCILYPENPEAVYNLLFCLPGELEQCGFYVNPAG